MRLYTESLIFHLIWLKAATQRCSLEKVFWKYAANLQECESLCNFIDITLRHGCSPVNLLHIFKTSFPKNISEWLLLYGVTRLITCQVRYVVIKNILQNRSQPSITYSKLTIETLEQGVKCVQVTNKDTRTTSVASIWCLYLLTLNIFHTLF